ncbi:MAG: 6-pyruvoyl-tetrahydropterin synthase-related protein, partial [Planctomycetota bacterium]|nr:6-pyruvoyl-tetrahydropterin synthase-related protein [Planctomycetota bacterium]
LILLPAWIERVSFVREGARWGEKNKAAHFDRSGEIEAVLDRVESSRPGRVYPGLAARWGGDYRVGSVPMHGVLTKESVDCLAFLYHAMSLPSDLMIHFDERRAAHYSMFNVSWVLAPADKKFPPFLELDLESGSSRLYRAPGGSVFEAIRADVTYRGEEADLYDIGKRWLDSQLPERGQYIEIQLGRGSGESSLSVDDPLPLPESLRGGSPGAVYDVESKGNTYRCTAHLREAGTLLFKMSYHPRWKVTVDGQERRPLLLTPGLCGVRLSPGRHTVSFRYSPPSWRWPLRLLGVLALTLPFFGVGRRALKRLEDGICSGWIAATRRARRALSSLPLARIRSEKWALLALFLIVLAASLPFLQASRHDGHDAVVYPRRLVEFHENIRNGILIPRWAPDLSHGYGQPQFIFAPPLLYILGEVFHLAGANVVLSIHFVCIMGIALGALGVFLLGRAFGGRWGGVLAAAAFTLGPYMLLDLYVRSAYAEALAIAFTPWILLGLWRLSEGSQRTGVTIAALGVAGVMLSHVGVALMFVPLCAFFVCALATSRKDAKYFMRGAGAIALGMALAAYFWVPAFIERGDVRMDRALGGSLDFRRHFVHVGQIWNSPWGYGTSVAGRGDEISLEAGKVQLVLALLILMALPFRMSRMKGRRVALVCLAIGAGAGMFLMTRSSSFLWEKIPLLQYLQFPWRFLSLVTVCLAAIASFLPALDPRSKPRAIGCGIVLAALIATQISHAGPKAYKPYIPKEHTALAIASGHLGVTTRREYEPRTVLQDTLLPDYSPIPAEFLDAAGEVELLGSHPEWKSIRVSREQPGNLRINLLHYAGWRAELDGVEIPLEIEEGPGRIIVSIPTGEHRLELRFHSTALRTASGCLSALALLGLVTSLILNRRRDRLQRALRDPKR